jgi:thiol-disulfide isomerase/thioredoxin
MKRRWQLVGGGIAVGVGLGLLLTSLPAPRLAPALAPETHERISDFQLEDLTGATVRRRDYLGQTLVLNFWATWCGPCRAELPILEAFHRSQPDGVTVLGINFAEPHPTVAAFWDDLGLTFPTLLDPAGRVEDLLAVRAFPTTLFIDGEGLLRFRHVGPLSEDQLHAYLAKIQP